jgi:hypothetical protein
MDSKKSNVSKPYSIKEEITPSRVHGNEAPAGLASSNKT